MPHLEEMYVNEKKTVRKEFHSTCIFIQGESFFLRESFKDRRDEFKGKFINPTLNLARGLDAELPAFGKIAATFGRTYEEGVRAFKVGIQKQEAFWNDSKEAAGQVLRKIEADPDKIGIVIVGRPYNSFAKETNKGIPYKFASRGYYTIPHDMLPWEAEPEDPDMFWEMGHRLLKASKFVKKHPQLYPAFIMNFLCAIDSLLVTYFRDIMGTKPSLTLELDEHTADAGINTRIEAFLDIIRNYRKVQDQIHDADYSKYVPSQLVMEKGKQIMINSKGERLALTDPKVKLLLPNMGNASSRLMAAVFRKLGINALALPPSDTQTLKYGRANTNSKECMPMHLVIGSLLKYIYHSRQPGENIVLFMPAAAGYCRMGQYRVFIREMLKKLNIRDVAMISLENENRYAGLGTGFTIDAWKAVVVGDAMKDIRNSLRAMAVDAEDGLRVYEEELRKLELTFEAKRGRVYSQLRQTAKRFAEIPRKFELDQAKFVSIIGEIFVRRDGFSRQGLIDRLAREEFVVRISPVSEWIYYMDYMIKHGMFEAQDNWGDKMERWLTGMVQRRMEKKIQRIMARSKLSEFGMIDLDTTIAHSTHVLPRQLKGEPGMMIGLAMHESLIKFAGIINIGPFGCMPVRYTESVLAPSMTVRGKKEGMKEAGAAAANIDLSGFDDEESLPMLTIESDGSPYPQLIDARIETFILQAKRIGEKIIAERKKKKFPALGSH
jgi:predicted nucleotide-binding protein (sugar kinase/HSP70/actin superfamily)